MIDHDERLADRAPGEERAAAQLDGVVAEIDAGRIECTSAERAYLVGAARALRASERID